MGRKKEANEEEAQDGRVHKAVHSVHDFGHFSQHGYFLVSPTI